MSDGFTVDVDEAEKACKFPGGSLPNAIELLRDPVKELIMYEDFRGREWFDATGRFQGQYQAWCEVVATRLERACQVMDDSAEALREIIDLYRRVDGQR